MENNLSSSNSLVKTELRKKMLAIRKSMETEEVRKKSRRIFELIKALDCYRRSGTIACYMSFDNEVSTLDFIQDCLNDGKRVIVPKVMGEERKLIFRRLTGLKEGLVPGPFGILEPSEELAQVPLGEADLIIVPGIAFDPFGNRLGFGAGYYDRALSKASENAVKIGVAFKFQIEGKIPAEPHDIPMDMVACEEGLINCRDKS